MQIDQVGRYTAGAGTVIYEGGAWPKKWDLSYFTSEPTLNIIGHFNVAKDGVSFKATKEVGREQQEFISSTNLWFRPIEVMTGPDGAMYIVDFCNQAIIHNDTRGPVHGPANAAVRPDRDHYYGRIWKVQHKEAKAIEPVSLDRNNVAALEKAAKSPNEQIRSTAQRLLREYHGAEPNIVGSDAVRAYHNALNEGDPVKIVTRVKAAQDDWTRSALVAASQEMAMEVIEGALKTEPNDSLIAFATALSPSAPGSRRCRSQRRTPPQSVWTRRQPSQPHQGAVLRALAENVSQPPRMTNAGLKRPLCPCLAMTKRRFWFSH